MDRVSRPLHIAISARAMSLPIGGVKEYVTAIVRELVKIGSPHRFSIYYADARLLGTNPEAQETYLAAPHKFIWDHWVLPRQLTRDRPDVIWFPHNVSSFGLVLPTVVSVMDMLYFRIPEFPGREYPWLDTLYMRAFIPHSVRRARRVMAISDWTGRDLVRLIGISRSKIKTIHLAPSSNFKPVSMAERDAIRARYGLARPFFFYAGILSPRKNLRVLIDAFGRVQHTMPHDLVLTGGGGYSETRLDDLIARHGIAARIRRLGAVPQDELTALYGAADAFIFPSLYEGFGLPPLEAFACGCPVVSSNATSLAEVVGDAALTFDPHDVDTLAAHLKAIGTDAALRERLIHSGFARVHNFNYARAARELIQLLEEAVT
jgi:glycosyltransferase involved in cell wall biosynthesis